MGSLWDKVSYSGPNGLFLVVLSLGWWGKAVEGGSGNVAEFETAVEDVTWVLSEILSGLPNIPAKRARVEDDQHASEKPKSKR